MNRVALQRIVVLLTVAGLLYAATILPLDSWLNSLVSWTRADLLRGGAIYVCIVVVGTIVFVPGSVMMMLGGFLFGFVNGSILLIVTIPVAAQCAFFISRWFGHAWLREKVAARPRIGAFEDALQERAFTMIILLRASLVLPFNLLNYVLGATNVLATTHIAATAIGMLVPTFLYTYLGSVAGDVAAIVSGDATPSSLGYWVGGIGLTAIGAAAWMAHKAVGQALDKQLSDNGR